MEVAEAATPPDGRFLDDAQERDYQGASALFLNPPRVQEKSRLLLTSLAMFVIVSMVQGGSSVLDLATLIGVVLAHELGHALGMVVFGYSDVRIFFIPLFGGAASGRKRGVSRWKEGVVLLLGPVPGLVAGTIMLVTGAEGIWHTVALQLVAINGFNLLPLAPLDGGQLFQLILFSRHRHTELGFQAVAALALAAGGAYLKMWILAALGVFILLRTPLRKSLLGAAEKLRAEKLPRDPLALSDAQRRTLFTALWEVMPPPWRGKPAIIAAQMDQLLDVATRQPTGLGISLGLFVAWAAAVGVGVVAVIALRSGPPAHWRTYEDKAHQFSVELPAPPMENERDVAGLHQTFLSTAQGGNEYAVTWFQIDPQSSWKDKLLELYGATRGKKLGELAMPGGEPALITELRGRQTFVLLRGEGNTGFVVLIMAGDEDAQRVLRSFKLRPR